MPTIAFEIPGFRFTLEADASLATDQFRALVVDASGDASRAGAGVDIVGILQNKPSAAGQAAQIINSGISKASAGAAVTAGDLVMSDANGQLITATATNFAVGRALTPAGAEGEIFSVLLGAGAETQ